MPIYEYVCKNCSTKFERLCLLNEGHKTDCPACGRASHRVMSLIASHTIGKNEAPMPAGVSGCAAGGGASCRCRLN